MIYFKLFFYGMGFEGTGPMVQMVFTIGWAIKGWAVLLFLVMVSFASSLMVLYQYTPYALNENYTNFGYSLLMVGAPFRYVSSCIDDHST